MEYFLWALTILFIGLKLTKFIDWNWFLVLTPFFVYLSFIILGIVFYIFVSVMAEKEKRR